MIENGELTEVVIDALSTDGRGIARIEGRACFVPRALPGDRVRLQLDPRTQPISGTIVEQITPSPLRVAHPCPHAKTCIGSPWGALRYDEQLRHKQELVRRTLRDVLDDAQVLPTVASPQEWHYRNRVSLHTWIRNNHIEAGFRTEARQNDGVAIQICKLASSGVASGIEAVTHTLPRIDIGKIPAIPARIQIHDTRAGAGALLIFANPLVSEASRFWEQILHRDALPGGLWFAAGSRAGVIDFHREIIRGKDALPMRTSALGREIEIHPAAFCQANSSAAGLVEVYIREWVDKIEPERVWDLYGGYGALGSAAAGQNLPLTIFEISPLAGSTALDLGEGEHGERIRFICGDLLNTLPAYFHEIESRDLIILDPPRSGAHRDVLKMISQSKARNVFYLSCNPAKLARDMKSLRDGGFRPSYIQPFDFFPQTPSIEALAILTR